MPVEQDHEISRKPRVYCSPGAKPDRYNRSLIGGLAGAKMTTNLSNTTLEKIFGAALLLISLKMIFGK